MHFHHIYTSKFWCSVEDLNQIHFLALVYTEIILFGTQREPVRKGKWRHEERTVPRYFLLVNKPVKSAVKTFRHFLLQWTVKRQVKNSKFCKGGCFSIGLGLWLFLGWFFSCLFGFFVWSYFVPFISYVFYFYVCFLPFGYKGKLNWPYLQY